MFYLLVFNFFIVGLEFPVSLRLFYCIYLFYFVLFPVDASNNN